ncbi:coatomer subunit zeta [Gaeumannomyces tritici R3-111a-1]|uniref:Coatomer subunit zeta n=1 Tax=Gaeumannomyces tritici (strain R3-111a-1) TaxID=644352 RepID=J3NVV5_GAET3|nr:coatomer subunit zeta [Gaeumannomyces tritici R3-111a-1]EJT75484.1 coatomer subunit zeta [Gaeumannomyces tritici R3-111a-1]
MAPGMSLVSVNAIIILSTDDASRIFAKYYTAPHHAAPGAGQAASATAPPNPYADVKAQKSFEKGLLDKTAKQTGDIILYDNRIVLYKMESDVMMYVVGGVDENEVLLYNVILALRDSLHLLFKQSVDKRTIIENYDLVSLAIDEIVDDGIILETDPTIVVQRVSKAPTQDSVNLSRIDPFSEQGVNNLAQFGKAKLTDWLRQGL